MNLELFLENCWDHKFRDIEYWGTDYPQRDRYNLKENLVSIKPYKERNSKWWNYKAVVPKKIDTATKLDIECTDGVKNYYTEIFPRSTESKNPIRPSVEKSENLKTFRIKRVTSDRDEKYIYYKP